MKNNGKEHEDAKPHRNPEPGCNQRAIKERMQHQSTQSRVRGTGVYHLLMMRLFPEMKMSCDGVFHKVHEKIACQDDCRRTCVQLQAARHHLQYGRSEHESSTERHQSVEESPPNLVLRRDDEAPRNVCERGRQSQRKQHEISRAHSTCHGANRPGLASRLVTEALDRPGSRPPPLNSPSARHLKSPRPPQRLKRKRTTSAS